MVVDMKYRDIIGRNAALALAIAAAPLGGCMEFDPGAEGEIELRTHVTDWRDEVIYQLLVDRFADGDAGNNFRVDLSAPGKWHGGDWKGVEDKLDYLEQLGVTTLWISPIIKNVDTDAGYDGYHGYWAQDLTQLNPHFGDLPALRSMVNAAHERGMKVILDIVTNHLGQLFYYDVNLNGEPDERVRGSGITSEVVHINEYDPDFDSRGIQSSTSLGESGPAPIIFVFDPASNHVPPSPAVFLKATSYNRKGRTYNFEDPDQLLHGDFPGGLKDVNTVDCEVKEAMVDSYARWVELADLDGFRIDTVKHVEREFWRFFTQKVRRRLAAKGKNNFFMFGEGFDGRDILVGSYTLTDPPSDEDLKNENKCMPDGVDITGDQLDGMFYFPQYFQAIRDVFQLSQSTQRIQELWAARPLHYGTQPTAMGTGLPPVKTLVNFLDNHDVPRFLYAGSGTRSLQNALLFIFTEDGIPCIYYGTEQELAGGNDPANREDLWAGRGYDTTGGTFQWISRISKIRRSYPALTRGDQTVVWATPRTGDERDAGVFAFERTGGDAGDQYALVVFNTHVGHPSAPEFGGAPMKVNAAANTVLVDVLSPDQRTYTVAGDQGLAIELPPQSGAILIPQAQVIPGL
jgi:alpha-amylase